jgi:hypothetical protein
MATNTTRATPTDADESRPRLTDASPRRSTDMVTTTTPASTSDEQVRIAACHMYDAECALHVAHQSHVDAWIAAANSKLHAAIAEHLAAVAAAEHG